MIIYVLESVLSQNFVFHLWIGFVVVLDIDEERIHLETAENTSLEKLPSKVPENSARYHLYKFKHTHEGDYTESIGIESHETLFSFLFANCFFQFLFIQCQATTVPLKNVCCIPVVRIHLQTQLPVLVWK